MRPGNVVAVVLAGCAACQVSLWVTSALDCPFLSIISAFNGESTGVGTAALQVSFVENTSGRGETAVLCMLAKDEEAYLDEFVEYNTAIGFTKIFLYSNTVDFEMEQWGEEKMRLGYPLNVTHWPGEAVQNVAMLDCAKRAMAEGHTWVAVFDTDEYLILKRHSNVVSFLKDYCKKGGLSLFRIYMGSAGREVYSPQPVAKRFQYAVEPVPGVNQKSVTVLKDINISRMPNPHKYWVKGGRQNLVTSGEKVRQYDHKQAVKNLDVAVLYHFYYRSDKEFRYKRLARGRGTRVLNKKTSFATANLTVLPGTIVDATAWRVMKKYLPKYRYFDKIFPDQPQTLPGSSAARKVGERVHKAALCIEVKNEEAYLDEFTEYYTAIGFHKIYIYDNTEDFDLKQWSIEKMRFGYPVNATRWLRTVVQGPAMLDCAKRALAERHTWVAFFNVNEYLILKKHSNVVSFLEDHCKEGTVSLFWITMGTGRKEVYSPQPVTKRFKYRTEYSNEGLKSIAIRDHIDIVREPHGRYPCLKNGHEGVKTPGQTCTPARHRVDLSNSDTVLSMDVAVLYHYAYKSRKEYVEQLLNSGDTPADMTDLLHKRIIATTKSKNLPEGTYFDDMAWKAVTKLLPSYKLYDELFPDPDPVQAKP